MDSFEAAQGAKEERYQAFNAVLIVICVIGLIGNALVFLFVFVTKDHKKSATNWYVIHLAIADTLFLFTIILRLSFGSTGRWPSSTLSCIANQTLLYVNYYASVLFLMVMSIDRYIAVCHWLSSTMQRFRKPHAAYIMTLVVWAVAILLSVPVMIYTDRRGFEPNCFCQILFPGKTPRMNRCQDDIKEYPEFNYECPTKLCLTDEENEAHVGPLNEFRRMQIMRDNANNVNEVEASTNTTMTSSTALLPPIESADEIMGRVEHSRNKRAVADRCFTSENELKRAHIWINFTVMFLLPVLVMSVCYGLIVRKFRNTAMEQSGISRKMLQKNSADGDRRRLTIMCVALVAVFTVCWFLYHMVEIVRQYSYFSLTVAGCEILENAGIVMIYINSALNPYLYSFLGTGFARKWQGVKESSLGKWVASMISTTGVSMRDQHRPSNVNGQQAQLELDVMNSENLNRTTDTMETGIEKNSF